MFSAVFAPRSAWDLVLVGSREWEGAWEESEAVGSSWPVLVAWGLLKVLMEEYL